LDISIVPVWTPKTHTILVTADLGSKLSSSTDEWRIDGIDWEDLGFVKLKYRPEVNCMATRTNAICKKKFFFKFHRLVQKE